MSEMLDDILSLENISLAVAKVCSNKGAGGVDGMDVEEIHEYMAKEWPATKELIRERKYRPMPVLRVEIPKTQRRSEETRDTYGGGQGDTTGDSTEAVTYV